MKHGVVAAVGLFLAVAVHAADTAERATPAPSTTQAWASNYTGADAKGAWCTVQSDPECGGCAASCPIGQAATCVPATKTRELRGSTHCAVGPICKCGGTEK